MPLDVEATKAALRVCRLGGLGVVGMEEREMMGTGNDKPDGWKMHGGTP